MTQLEKRRRDLAYLAVLERSAEDKAAAERARLLADMERAERVRARWVRR